VPVFVDSNVLVYARDSSEADRQPRAQEWLDRLWRRGVGRLSVQVLHEFYVTVTQKLDPGLPSDEARQDVGDLLRWGPLAMDGRLIQSAWMLQDRYSVAFWDALIIAAARRSTCEYLLSEDLQDGQDFDGTRVVNPSRHRPDELGI
jgi:predicted nucleic acid-binding protein